MKKIILTIAVTILSIVTATNAQAGPKTGGNVKTSNVSKSVTPISSVKFTNTVKPTSVNKIAKVNPSKANNYALQHATKFSQGFFYKGKNHKHWGQIRFDVRYGCNCYWDPCLSIWYYWCEPDFCYYPVSYCPYRCYSCTEVVNGQPVGGAATLSPDGASASSEAPPINDIPPIPEPVDARK